MGWLDDKALKHRSQHVSPMGKGLLKFKAYKWGNRWTGEKGMLLFY